MWPWTLAYQKFLLCVSIQGQDLYSHQKLNMYIYWFSSESSYRQRRQRRLQTPTTTTLDTAVQPLGRHIANKIESNIILSNIILIGYRWCELGWLTFGHLLLISFYLCDVLLFMGRCLSQTGVLSKQLNKSSSFLVHRLFLTYLTLLQGNLDVFKIRIVAYKIFSKLCA